MRQLYRPESSEEVPLGDGRIVPEKWAYGETDDKIVISTRYHVRDGKAVASAYYVRPLDGDEILDPVNLEPRQFNTRAVDHAVAEAEKIREFNRLLADPVDVDEEDYEEDEPAPRRRQRAPKRALTPELLQEVAKVHAEQDQMRATQGVARHYNVKVPTAQAWVDRARRDGYL